MMLNLSQRNWYCGVGLVAAGLFEPWTWVWQFRHPRACVKLMALLPVCVPPTEPECVPPPEWAGEFLGVLSGTELPLSVGMTESCGVWHEWHRKGVRIFSMFSV
ncbi:MAG TPA: hypothetical protein VL334_18990, partial [Anaerolineae bacterium]|nr:hypothetical protein [Anaerolineae bacterium]